MDEGWIRVILMLMTMLVSIGVVWGAVQGRLKALEKAEKQMVMRLNKHENEIEKLVEIRLNVNTLVTQMEAVTDLLKEMRDRPRRTDDKAT